MGQKYLIFLLIPFSNLRRDGGAQSEKYLKIISRFRDVKIGGAFLEQNRFSSYTQRDIDFLKWRVEHPYISQRNQTLFDLICQNRPEAILEVGCSEGFALNFIRPVKYVGIDTSLVRLQLASIRNEKHAFIRGDGTFLPVRSEQFDLVFCMGTIHHLRKQQAFFMIKEMVRVCKPTGWVAIIEPNAYNPSLLLFGLLRKRERGILHCHSKLFSKYFKRLGMEDDIRIDYVGTLTPLYLFGYIFRNRNFVKSYWFIKIWGMIDSILNRVIPKEFRTNLIVMVKKDSRK